MKAKATPRFWIHRGRKFHSIEPIVYQPMPLAEMDARGWAPQDRYRLHVDDDGNEIVVPDIAAWDGRSGVVTIEAVGDGWVDESTRVGTVEDYQGVALIHRVIPPHGAGWERDEERDRDFDKWSGWKRRRAVGGKL